MDRADELAFVVLGMIHAGEQNIPKELTDYTAAWIYKKREDAEQARDLKEEDNFSEKDLRELFSSMEEISKEWIKEAQLIEKYSSEYTVSPKQFSHGEEMELGGIGDYSLKELLTTRALLYSEMMKKISHHEKVYPTEDKYESHYRKRIPSEFARAHQSNTGVLQKISLHLEKVELDFRGIKVSDVVDLFRGSSHDRPGEMHGFLKKMMRDER